MSISASKQEHANPIAEATTVTHIKLATLLFAIDNEAAFDLLLLDIYMPEQTGIEGARF